jgi:hypothetical protein
VNHIRIDQNGKPLKHLYGFDVELVGEAIYAIINGKREHVVASGPGLSIHSEEVNQSEVNSWVVNAILDGFKAGRKFTVYPKPEALGRGESSTPPMATTGGS